MSLLELSKTFTTPIPDITADTTINAVFGVKDHAGLPSRMLWGFIPGAMMAEHYEQAGVPTHLRVFIPQHIGHSLNHLDHQQAQNNVTTGVSLIRHFMATFHPDLALAIEPDQPLTKEAVSILTQIALIMTPLPDKGVRDMVKLGERHGTNAQDTLQYAAHHPFGWQDLVSTHFFAGPTPINVVNCLPPSEKPFANIRQLILREISSHHPHLIHLIRAGTTHDLFTVASGSPHYVLIRSGEPTIQEIALEPQGEKWALNDLDQRIADETNDSVRANLIKAKQDLMRVIDHIESARALNRNLPNLTELIQQSLQLS